MFKQQCIEVYRKLHPSFQFEAVDPFETEPEPSKQEVAEDSRAIYLLGDGDTLVTDDCDEEKTITQEVDNITQDQDPEQEQDYENIYFELEDGEGSDEKYEVVDVSARREVAVKPRMNRKSYTVEQKLKIIEYGEETNNRVAARHFKINESTVRCFRRKKEELLKMNPARRTNRKAFPHWPLLEIELKEFVNDYPKEHGKKAKLKDIQVKAVEIAAKHGIDGFNGSNSYIFKFMQRHSLPSASPRPRKAGKKVLPKEESNIK